MSATDESTEPRVDAVVIGGGMAGLAAAADLRERGRSVTLLEAGPSVGGLARAIRVGGEPIEAYYHHVFPQDRATRELIDLLGLADRLEWRRAPMAIMHGGRAYPFDGPLDVLRFRPLSPWARLRLGAGTALQIVRPDRARLDRRSVAEEGPLSFGQSAYDLVWRPLLEAKFGSVSGRIPMAWLVARIRQRAGGRRAGGDRLGYLRGSLGTLAEAYAAHVAGLGVRIAVDTRVTAIARRDGRWVVGIDGASAAGSDEAGAAVSGGVDGAGEISADAVVACVSGGILGRLVDLPSPYREAVGSIEYRGVVCVLAELSRSLSPYYWVNVTDRLGMGCVGIIEHTNFIPADRYGGTHLVYLAHYVDRAGPAWSASAEELLGAVEPALARLNPDFRRDWVTGVHLSRDPFAQPIPQVGGPMPGLPVETGAPGLVHASLAHIYPDDRGVSLALGLGRRAADAAERHLRSLAG